MILATFKMKIPLEKHAEVSKDTHSNGRKNPS